MCIRTRVVRLALARVFYTHTRGNGYFIWQWCGSYANYNGESRHFPITRTTGKTLPAYFTFETTPTQVGALAQKKAFFQLKKRLFCERKFMDIFRNLCKVCFKHVGKKRDKKKAFFSSEGMHLLVFERTVPQIKSLFFNTFWFEARIAQGLLRGRGLKKRHFFRGTVRSEINRWIPSERKEAFFQSLAWSTRLKHTWIL